MNGLLLLGISVLGWLVQFLGWPIPFLVPALVAIAVLTGLLWDKFRHGTLQLSKFISFMLFVGLAVSSWIGHYWESHHFPIASISVMRFSMIAFLFLLAFMVMTYLHSDKDGQVKKKPPHDNSFKISFKRKAKEEDKDDDIKIILGERLDK